MLVFRIAGAAADVAARPARGAWRVAGLLERRARHRAVTHGGRLTLVCVDAALASPYANEAVQRVVDSDLAERAVARALSGGLVDVVAADLVRFRVVERVVDNVFVRAAVDRALEGEELTRIVARALESPGAERLVGLVVESRVVEEASATQVTVAFSDRSRRSFLPEYVRRAKAARVKAAGSSAAA